MIPDPERVARVALAARDTCRAVIVLATLADGPATNAELRRAAGWPGDSFRSLLRRMAREGLIERAPSRRWRRTATTRVVDGSIDLSCRFVDERLAA